MKPLLKILACLAVLGLLAAPGARAQEQDLRAKLRAITAPARAQVGVSLLVLEDGKAVNLNGDKKFPMQSVFKFPIALAVLRQVDQGRLSLDQAIALSPAELRPNTWSPLRKKYPQGGVELPLAEILRYTVALSDNNGCDILLRLLGGPGQVQACIHSLGIRDFAMAVNEHQMHQRWEAQFANWITPTAATDLLRLFYQGKILSPPSHAFLWELMSNTPTGAKRIKGLLPPGTEVAHKTGTSGRNEQGVMAAVNDVGIVTLPDGKHLAMAVLITDSKEEQAANEKIIARVSRAAWDHFGGKAAGK